LLILECWNFKNIVEKLYIYQIMNAEVPSTCQNFPQADKHDLERVSGESAADIKTAFPVAEHNP
jgi:hypothetical protein